MTGGPDLRFRPPPARAPCGRFRFPFLHLTLVLLRFRLLLPRIYFSLVDSSSVCALQLGRPKSEHPYPPAALLEAPRLYFSSGDLIIFRVVPLGAPAPNEARSPRGPCGPLSR
ncbi:unnamed protein product, partial [Prorocentrum cordatum]